MNLRTAALLCERFLLSVKEGNLLDELSEVLTKGDMLRDAVAAGNKPPKHLVEALQSAATKARTTYEGSVFADPAMKIFPEFDQLGFGSLMGEEFKESLDIISDGDGNDVDLAANLARIGRQGEGISELTEQLEKLMSVADYFGVESRSTFTSEAIAVVQMPQGQAGKDSNGNVDAFIDRMESFQSLVDFCGASEEASGSNIRMISGDDALMVADLSVEGAHKLQNLISEVKSAKADILEIENATERLKNVGVNDNIIDLLNEEVNFIRAFDPNKAGTFIRSLIDGETGVTAKWMADAVMGLVEQGARIDSVVLRSEKSVATSPDIALDDAKAMAEKGEGNEGDKEFSDKEADVSDKQGAGAASLASAWTDVSPNVQSNDNKVAIHTSSNPSEHEVAQDSKSGETQKANDQKTDDMKNVSETLSEAPASTRKTETSDDEAANGASAPAGDTPQKELVRKDQVNDAKTSSKTVQQKNAEGAKGDDKDEDVDTRDEVEVNSARARKKNLRSIWEAFSGRT